MATRIIWSTKSEFVKMLRTEPEFEFPVYMMQSNGRRCLDRTANDAFFADIVDTYSLNLPDSAQHWSLSYSEGGQ